MKKILILSVVMLFAVASMASAYVITGSAKDSTGSNFMNSPSLSDMGNATSKLPTMVAGKVACALPAEQGWVPGGSTGDLYYKLWTTSAPNVWTLCLFGSEYAEATAHVRFWIQSVGNDAQFGANITGQTWELKNKVTGEVMWTGLVDGSKSAEANAWVDVWLPVVNTSTPAVDAGAYTLGPVPEPGSMLAMLSGLVGLVGYGIRRRK